MTIVREPIGLALLRTLAEQRFGDMVKAVVDVERRVMSVGAELHADDEAGSADNVNSLISYFLQFATLARKDR